MPAYLMVEIDVHDPEGHKAYQQAGPPTLAAYGARLLARGEDIAVFEGDWNPKRLVIAEFPDLDAAKAWYASQDYQEAKKLREHTASLNMVAVSGA